MRSFTQQKTVKILFQNNYDIVNFVARKTIMRLTLDKNIFTQTHVFIFETHLNLLTYR